MAGRSARAQRGRPAGADRRGRRVRQQHQPPVARARRTVRPRQGRGARRALPRDQPGDRCRGRRAVPRRIEPGSAAGPRPRHRPRRLRQPEGETGDDGLVPAPQAAADRLRVGGRAHRPDPGARARPLAYRARRDAGAGAQAAARRTRLPAQSGPLFRRAGGVLPRERALPATRRQHLRRAPETRAGGGTQTRLRSRPRGGDARHRHVRLRDGRQGDRAVAEVLGAAGRATSQPNSACALRVVAAARASSVMPRRCATSAAITARRAGSLRRPRWAMSGWSGASVSSSR